METGLEQERLQQEAELNQKVNEEEVQSSLTACKQRGTWFVELLRSQYGLYSRGPSQCQTKIHV